MTEAAICRTLHHPNIVATYAYDLAALQQAPRAAAAAGGQGGSHGNSSQVSGSKSGESHHEQVVGFRGEGGGLWWMVDMELLASMYT
jgi:hypothetical protein